MRKYLATLSIVAIVAALCAGGDAFVPKVTPVTSTDYCDGFAGLFCDDFEDGNANGWYTLGSGVWTVENGWYVLHNPNTVSYSFTGDENWSNYVFEADFQKVGGSDFGFYVRVPGTGNSITGNLYAVIIRGWDIVLIKYEETEQWRQNYAYSINTGINYHIIITLNGDNIQVRVDNDLVVNYSDVGTSVLNGRVALSSSFATDVMFDNVVVTEPPPHIALGFSSLSLSATQNGTIPETQTLTISNSGGGTLDWYIDEQIPWLEISVWQGTSNFAQIDVSANTTNLAPGTYNGTMTVTSNNADNSPQVISVSYEVLEEIIPIVLVHGWTSGPDVWTQMQFRLVVEDNFSHVWVASLIPCGDLEEGLFDENFPSYDYTYMYKGNARRLANFINQQYLLLPQAIQDRVHRIDIVAHSMGGLVSRRYISSITGDEWSPMHVRNLIMLGTPNSGSAFAGHIARFKSVAFNACDGPASDELDKTHMKAFNGIYQDHETITDYFSVWGSSGVSIWGPFNSCYLGIGAFEDPPNDGIVSEYSATHGSALYSNSYRYEYCHPDYVEETGVYEEVIKPVLSGGTPSIPPANAFRDPRAGSDSIPQLIYYVEDSVISGEVLTDSIIVESCEAVSLILFVVDSNATFFLRDPSNTLLDTATFSLDSTVGYVSVSGFAKAFHIINPQAGIWQYSVATANCDPGMVQIAVEALVQSNIHIQSSQSTDYPLPGDTLWLTIAATAGGLPLSGLTATGVEVWNRFDTLGTFEFNDDGEHNDGSANDGTYGAAVTFFKEGIGEFKCRVIGSTSDDEFIRFLDFSCYCQIASPCDSIWFRDADEDGYGDSTRPVIACPEPDGYTADASDNCVEFFNPDQRDSNGNGIGDVCETQCGDVNADLSIDIADLTYLVAYMFKGGAEPAVLDKANVNGQGGLDIADLTYLVAFMFKSGPAPVCQ